MIDEEFQPHRIEVALLGELLLQFQQYPLSPAIQIDELYSRATTVADDLDQAILDTYVEDLEDNGLVAIQDRSFQVGDRVGDRPIDVRLTVAGAYYCVSRAHTFLEQERGLTSDLNGDYGDVASVIFQRFGPTGIAFIPASDRIVSLNDNQPQVLELQSKLDEIISLLATDNEIGSRSPMLRDEKMAKLRELKDGLSNPEVRFDYIMFLGIQSVFWIGAAFAEKPIGFLADQAWDALKNLIGF